MLRVLGRVTSINVRKVLWTLDELGLTYEREDWGLPLRDPNTAQFTALNPNATVPVLVESDGTALWESNAILIYLARTHGALLAPGGRQFGLALQWLGWQASDLTPTMMYAFLALVRKAPGYDAPDAIAQSRSRWTAKMTILEGELDKSGKQGQPFIAGPDFSIADIVLGLSVHRWRLMPFERPDLPAVDAYYTRLRARPPATKWMADDVM